MLIHLTIKDQKNGSPILDPSISSELINLYNWSIS